MSYSVGWRLVHGDTLGWHMRKVMCTQNGACNYVHDCKVVILWHRCCFCSQRDKVKCHSNYRRTSHLLILKVTDAILSQDIENSHHVELHNRGSWYSIIKWVGTECPGFKTRKGQDFLFPLTKYFQSSVRMSTRGSASGA